MAKRVFLIVLDSLGVGEMPDAAQYGDAGSNTLRACHDTGALHVPNLADMGLFCIDGVNFGPRAAAPRAAFGRLAEQSAGKDTTSGHWEIAGLVSSAAMPTYPNGFPDSLIKEYERRIGRSVLCNKPYSGTQLLLDYGQEHEKTGSPIVYTSADSVFQIAAHEQVIPVAQLYEFCEIAREMLCGEHSVGRVIARPFVGEYPNYTRTANRHDYSLAPPGDTVLDLLKRAGRDVLGIGKIYDIFAGKGLTDSVRTTSNADGMNKTMQHLALAFHGLCFVNLVDFDSVYGHRNDAPGYARALSEFDAWLGAFLPELQADDVLMITADHGCDPSTESTDHSREYIPLLVYGAGIAPQNLGTRGSFADIGQTVARLLDVPCAGCAGQPIDC